MIAHPDLRWRRAVVALLLVALVAAAFPSASRASAEISRRTRAVNAAPGTLGRPAADDGYRLWLRYERIPDGARRREYLRAITEIVGDGAAARDSPRGSKPSVPAVSLGMQAAQDELSTGLSALLGRRVPVVPGVRTGRSGAVLLGTPSASASIASLNLGAALRPLGDEGYLLARRNGRLIVAANSERGVLYGVFALLRHLQTLGSLRELDVRSAPARKLRMLDHWDNLDGTVERGYAGRSLWDWGALPERLDGRYRDYARAMASIGLNATTLNNVNADARILTAVYLRKVAALATVFRPYGVRVFLAARFSAPRELGGRPALGTADPKDPRVAAWWRAKADEIYSLVPDFGGFLVKANSEGQPGPQEYRRTHADGANVLAEALAPHGGVVIWRGFVYDHRVADDRAKQAYAEFQPLDGAFRENALVQLKNGPIDFQPREPFHPLFGAMPRTALVLELQITQEYLGFASHLVYLGPLFKEALDSDTYATGPGSTVASIVAGIAGVANIGRDRNWCGHPFAQANWYAFGRLAWDPGLAPARIADEWLRMTFTNDARFIDPVQAMMLASREAAVDYMTPLGLHHLMAKDHHHGPGPWVAEGRPDWTSVYYHRADAVGIGFDRTAAGSNAVSQYHDPWPARFSNPATCPESLLLWFHHLSWDHRMPSGRSLWDELCLRYQRGVDAVHALQRTWDSLDRQLIDAGRFDHVRKLLRIQEAEARWWRDASILYFQQFAKRPFPRGVTAPAQSLDYYRHLTAEQEAAGVSPGP